MTPRTRMGVVGRVLVFLSVLVLCMVLAKACITLDHAVHPDRYSTVNP